MWLHDNVRRRYESIHPCSNTEPSPLSSVLALCAISRCPIDVPLFLRGNESRSGHEHPICLYNVVLMVERIVKGTPSFRWRQKVVLKDEALLGLS